MVTPYEPFGKETRSSGQYRHIEGGANENQNRNGNAGWVARVRSCSSTIIHSAAQRFQFREALMTVSQRTLVTCMLIACLGFAANAIAQGPDAALPRTMRPVIRGRQAAVSSMKAEATEVASRIGVPCR